MSSIDSPFSHGSGQHVPQQLTAEDFQIYAPKALAAADLRGEGLATKAELSHMVAQPAPGEDLKTQDAMRFLLDHYDLLAKLSKPVQVGYIKEDAPMPLMPEEKVPHYEYGITPDALKKIDAALKGQKALGPEDMPGDPSWAGGAGAALGFGAGALGLEITEIAGIDVIGAEGLATGAAAGLMTGGAAIVGAAVAGLVGYIAYEAVKFNQKKQWQKEASEQYSNFLSDIKGAESIREKPLQENSAPGSREAGQRAVAAPNFYDANTTVNLLPDLHLA